MKSRIIALFLAISTLSVLVNALVPNTLFDSFYVTESAVGTVSDNSAVAFKGDTTASDETGRKIGKMRNAESLRKVKSYVADADSLDTTNVSSDTVYVKPLTVDSVEKMYSNSDSILLLLQKDSIIEILVDTTRKDTVRQDTVKSKSALDYPVHYTAKDSITFDYENSRASFYGESKVDYQNLNLEAEIIELAIDSSIVHARPRIDSTGMMLGAPVFKQGEDTYEPDAIDYNFKSKRAFIQNVFSKQGEGKVVAAEAKRDSAGTLYMSKGKYTTCDASHPHFYFRLTRAKMHPGKNVFFGPAQLYVEDVPLPLAIPYGFFPMTDSYSSGIIMPSYGDETTRGFYLRDGGYYFAINDKIDVKTLGEIYTKGSWGISSDITYRKRYKFSGNFFFSYQNTKEGEKNMPDYSVQKSFKITWSHRQDSKANPSQSFSASVNFATSSFERNNLQSMYNPESYTQSNRTSSISYSKTFQDIGLTLSTTFNLSQSLRDSSIALTLPTLNISLSRMYPFKRKKAAGAERWYEKIAFSYTGTLSNSINTKENLLFKSNLIKDWRNGMRHQVPISANFTVLNYINISPSFNFTDRMYTNKTIQRWDAASNKVEKDIKYGFYNVYNYNMSLSANTKLYGMYTPMPWFGGKKIQAIRHVFTPTVSLNFAPDFGHARYGYWENYIRTDADGNIRDTIFYSPYQGALYGSVGQGRTGSLNLDVSNNVEMKLLTDNDSVDSKKISIIDELGGSLSYNMAAKDRPWSDLSMRVRLKLTKSYTFSMNAVFATYAYEKDANGRVFVGKKTEWSQGRFGRFQGMSQNLSYTFNNQTFKTLFGKKDKNGKSKNSYDDEEDEEEENDPHNTNLDPNRAKAMNSAKGEKSGVDEDGYLKFQMPWSFSISYGVSLRENTSAQIREKRMRYPYKLTHTLNFSGNLRLSSQWNINFNSGYDFNYHKLSMTSASLSRDLHCFSMSASMVIAPYRSYNFTFACKASTLTDALKWRKNSSYRSNIEWY